MDEFPVVSREYFYPIYLNELIDPESYTVKCYVKDKTSVKQIADSIILDVKYPIHWGLPDDTHVLSMYFGRYRWTKVIFWDFWDKGSMVLGTNKVADCDGSTIAFVTACRSFGVSQEDVFAVFGVVKQDGRTLGGHAWAYVRDRSFGTFRYVLVETTLDTPPEKYPEVGDSIEDLKRPFYYNGIWYEPEFLFNDKRYIGLVNFEYRKRFPMETVAKHLALEKAFYTRTKLLEQLRQSKTYKIRSKLRLVPKIWRGV